MRPRLLIGSMAVFVRVAKVSDVPPGQGRVVVAMGRAIALFNLDGSFCALSNVCLHRGGPIGEGELHENVVTCPLHGWEYDVRTGMNTINPVAKLQTFEVRVEGDDIVIGV